jgi:hypothetical protein
VQEPHFAQPPTLRLADLHGDLKALEAYFLDGKALESPGLERFASVFNSLPRLQRVYLEFKSKGAVWCSPLPAPSENFLQCTLSGMREIMLWSDLKERLQANDVRDRSPGDLKKVDGRVFVWVQIPRFTIRRDGDDITDFGKWMEWREMTYPKGVDRELEEEGDEVVVEDLGEKE